MNVPHVFRQWLTLCLGTEPDEKDAENVDAGEGGAGVGEGIDLHAVRRHALSEDMQLAWRFGASQSPTGHGRSYR